MSASRLLGLVAVCSWLMSGCNNSTKKIEVGGTCILNSDCGSSLLCTSGKCHDACHTSIDCPTGQSCVKANNTTICQLPAEADCSRTLCSSAYVCASDLRCRTTCGFAADCANGQVCVSSVCADPIELDKSTGQLPQKGPSLAADGGADTRATATGGAGGGNSGSADDAAVGGTGGAIGSGGTSSSAGGAGDAGATGGTKDAAIAPGGAGGTTDGPAAGGTTDAAVAPRGAGGSSGGATAGAGGTATADAGSSSDLRPADTAAVPDTKPATPDAASDILRDGGGSTVLTGCGKVTTKRYFCDDFESGLDQWHHGTDGWDLTTTTSQSASHSVTDSPNANYPDGAKSEITMVSSVDLSGAVSPIVTFWHRLGLAQYDNTYIDASSDGGNTWTVLENLTPTNNTSVWSIQQLSVTSYVGKKIKLRFRLEDSTGYGGTSDGWYVDDVEIHESDSPPPGDTTPQSPVIAEPTGCEGGTVSGRYFCEDFESGLSGWLVATDGWNTVAATSQSPTHSVTDSPNGNYPDGAKSDMTMASSVDLTGAVSPIVTFWHKLSLAVYDSTYIDASSDSGTTWTVVTTYSNGSNTSVWSFKQLSLAAYSGKKIKLRFRLVDSTGYGGTADGWYLDDIKIREDEFVPAPADLALCTTQGAGGGCNSSDLCGKTCGPNLLGSKSLTCGASTFVEGACTFPAGADYSCYKVGAAQLCAAGTKAGQACTATACQACGATTGTGYLDTNGAARQGYCVCSKGIWSCGTTAEWPCHPQTAGAAIPASCN